VITCLAVLASLVRTAHPAAAQAVDEMATIERLAVFLDCGFCDETFIRQEMTYVDYVRDREVAHVHVLVTRANTGAGGAAHTFDLIGRGPFQGRDYSTVYTTNVGATEAEQRAGLLRTLQATLVPYLLQTPVGERLTTYAVYARPSAHAACSRTSGSSSSRASRSTAASSGGSSCMSTSQLPMATATFRLKPA
jgi:hypothetical protein